ncbi:helix-turn-helix domain-containing protein [Aquibium microcysteis]|uniref:helix-turn-helix domain-containing protein n=1 Tax=Aquibium microcysteis TaxID=675281 RepID=UPI00165D1C21|nr:helix-turn-helix domain-containing protein [Aquibium microcysteis]
MSTKNVIAANRVHPSKTMKQLVLDHLKAGNDVSGIEAAALWRCRDLPKRISELRQDGHRIVREMRMDSTGQRYARYRWVSPAATQAQQFQGITANG